MFLLIEQKDLNKLYVGAEKVDNYKLCYIDEIPETYSDYTLESKKIMESDEYKKWEKEYSDYKNKELKEHGSFSYNICDNPWYGILCYQDYPNPERELGTHYAYFTPIELNEQWGDDWDDAPYDCNAGEPYDYTIEESKEVNGVKIASKINEYTIIKIPFFANENCVFPSFYGYNCPFTVKDINNGAVAWIYNGKEAIHAGINPYNFIEKIRNFCNKN